MKKKAKKDNSLFAYHGFTKRDVKKYPVISGILKQLTRKKIELTPFYPILPLEDWGLWKGELSRLRWLSASQQIIIRNLLFLTIPFDRPYTHTIGGLWSRQPMDSILWRFWERVIRLDFLCRAKRGWFRFAPREVPL